MDPVRCSFSDVVYRGINPDIGDLWCYRVEPGEIAVVYQPEPEELEVLKAGGRVVLYICTEPIPPVAVGVVSAEDSEPIGDHPFKVIPELEERDR